MKKLVAATIALAALLAGPAMAADMRVLKAPAPKEPPFVVYSWTGFYIGIQGGGGWSSVTQTDPRPFSSDRYQGTGGMIGGTVGFNVQWDYVVLGLEADGGSTWIKDATIGTNPLFGNCGGAPPRCFSNLKSLATFRGRAGVAMDNVLPYLTGGLAVGSLHGEEGDVAANGAWSDGLPASASKQCLLATGQERPNICTPISATASSLMIPSVARRFLKASDLLPISCASA